MYHFEIKLLFNGLPPTVSRFVKMASSLPEEKCKELWHKAYYSSLHGFDKKSKTYRRFYKLLVHSDRQRYLDFLQEKTLLGQMRYRPCNPELFLKIVSVLEQLPEQKRHALIELLFVLLLAFDYPQKINTLQQYLKTNKLTPSDLTDLLEAIQMI
jgi:hypothetical protein